ncbi:hypothetical protein ML401_34965 (plasmid) [Bradyrhizobium sp. 62B]|nr:hypothetical protein ML401_34965 [Bradyrhizobium sp. 62B]
MMTHAASDIRDRTGGALAKFFYGGHGDDSRPEMIEKLQAEVAGDYMSMLLIDGENQSSCTVLSLHHFFYRIPGKEYMIAHEYVHMNRAWVGTAMGQRRSGFAFRPWMARYTV